MPPPIEPRRPAEGAGFDFFFYGTLRDAAVRAAVFGRRIDAVPATLADHEAVPVRRGRYPILLFQRGRAAAGVLCRGASLAEAARLGFYEHEGRDYAARRLAVRLADGTRHPAWVFLPTGSLRRGTGRWDLAEWQRFAKRDCLLRIARAMRKIEAEDLEPFRELWRGRMAPRGGQRR